MRKRQELTLFVVGREADWSSAAMRIEQECSNCWEIVYAPDCDDACQKIRSGEAQHVLIDGNLPKHDKTKVKRAARESRVSTTTCTPYATAQIGGVIRDLQSKDARNTAW
ncbi:MAG: hypothetical protein NT039_02650 [Candidatus Berkelbacteria bacterium]|nr:hypothetical protein [Candidatus Berkelbacteria bacterium]